MTILIKVSALVKCGFQYVFEYVTYTLHITHALVLLASNISYDVKTFKNNEIIYTHI